MSRIGKKPITIPKGVKVEQSGGKFKVSGPQGTLEMVCHHEIKVSTQGDSIVVENMHPESRQHKAMHGTTRALLNNMVIGVSRGFERKMEIYGTGWNVKEQGKKLILNVGFCNPVEVPLPAGVKVTVEVPATKGNDTPAKFTIAGADKIVLGEFAAVVRKVRPPEPYLGKGIRYADEVIRRKEGKALATSGA
ncbi:MAG TPA: 50S ribosomal protein L6 [Sedimentisphaerales bacterium]|nr:50S ribosomal protein L6 [Sedimentisphaerales bacterium]